MLSKCLQMQKSQGIRAFIRTKPGRHHILSLLHQHLRCSAIAQHITVVPCFKCSGAVPAAFIWEQQKINRKGLKIEEACYIICVHVHVSDMLCWIRQAEVVSSWHHWGSPPLMAVDCSNCSRCTQMQPQQDEHILLCFPVHFKEKYFLEYLWLFQLKKGTRYPPGIHILNKLSSLQKGEEGGWFEIRHW